MDHPVKLLVDSGAAISVVRYDTLPENLRSRMKSPSTATVGANGLPLDVVGEIAVTLTMGSFSAVQTFSVVRNLTVDWLLGADFLAKHGAIIDYKEKKLHLGTSTIHLDSRNGSHLDTNPVSCMVQVWETVEIPGRAVMVVRGVLSSHQENGGWGKEGLVCPCLLKGLPKHLLIARSWGCVDENGHILFQVVNVKPEAQTMYKGTRVAEFIPSKEVMLVAEANPTMPHSGGPTLPELDLSDKGLTQPQQEALKSLLWSYRHVFAVDGGPMGRTSVVKHTIQTEGPPIRQPTRRIPVALQHTVKEEVGKMLQQGVIQPSSSPWSSPIVMVKKKNGAWRFCIDFRKVNSVTHKDAYPLPRIDATLDSLAGSSYFTTLDLASGYWQIEMEETDKEKTAFSTPQGHFEFNVMPFGLTNAPATFQRLMECVLAGLGPEQCLVYLDDIIVFGKSFEQHLQRLGRVFERLATSGLKLKFNKCQFVQREVHYLGHIISAEGVRADPAKMRAVTNYPVPTNVKELRQFLGLTNYYRKFVEHYAHITEPLHNLTRKSDKGYCWDCHCQNAFEKLKKHLTSVPILAYPRFDVPFTVCTDASTTAVGGVLSQVQDGLERVIAYWSRQLQKAERNYSTIEREALAVVGAVKEFYPYIYGFQFELVTDHNPLTSLKSLKDTGGRLTRWLLFLQQFNYEFKYRPGKCLGNADTLSRIPPSSRESSPSEDKEDQTIAVVQTSTWPLSDSDRIKEAQHKDPYLATVIKAVELGESPPGLTRQKNKIFLKDGVLCRRFRESSTTPAITQILIPIDLRPTILQQLHNCAGHLGMKKTLGKLRERYYWPGYEADTEAWVRECKECQQRNYPIPTPQAPLHTIEAAYPFQKLSMDIMGPLPKTSQGHKYILVVTDLFSKWTEAFPLATTDSETIARVLVDEVICRYGVPTTLHSDQAPNLCGQIVSSLCRMLGIDKTRTSAYHPQGNAQVERFNRTLEAMLSKMVQSHQQTWDYHLPKALFAYRTAIHEVTQFSPYFVTFGRSPKLPVDVMFGCTVGEGEKEKVPEYVTKLKHTLKGACDVIRSNIGKAHKKNKTKYDEKRSGNFQVGDRVWLHVPAVKVGNTRKLASLWRGPYTIVDKTSAVNYRIQLVGSNRPSLIVHHNRLKLCFGKPDRGNMAPHQKAAPQQQEATTKSYAQAVSNAPAGGYTSSEDFTSSPPTPRDPVSSPPLPREPEPPDHRSRPQRNRYPPVRYGEPIPH